MPIIRSREYPTATCQQKFVWEVKWIINRIERNFAWETVLLGKSEVLWAEGEERAERERQQPDEAKKGNSQTKGSWRTPSDLNAPATAVISQSWDPRPSRFPFSVLKVEKTSHKLRRKPQELKINVSLGSSAAVESRSQLKRLNHRQDQDSAQHIQDPAIEAGGSCGDDQELRASSIEEKVWQCVEEVSRGYPGAELYQAHGTKNERSLYLTVTEERGQQSFPQSLTFLIIYFNLISLSIVWAALRFQENLHKFLFTVLQVYVPVLFVKCGDFLVKTIHMFSGRLLDLVCSYGGKYGIVWIGGILYELFMDSIANFRLFWLEIKWSIVRPFLDCWLFENRSIRLNGLLKLIDERSIIILHRFVGWWSLIIMINQSLFDGSLIMGGVILILFLQRLCMIFQSQVF